MISILDHTLTFPNPSEAEDDGLLAIGGDLSTERLLLAYRSGIFPWFMEEDVIFWYCPPERFVLFPENVQISHSMKQLLRKGEYTITEDADFEKVIRLCAAVHEQRDGSTWISEDFIQAYITLNRKGFAHSVEVWKEGQLAGGLYGVVVGKVFSGESMFSLLPNASKAALIHVCRSGKFQLIDCQMPTDHLASMGAQMIPRDEFIGKWLS